jgi:hypothetical protein
MERVERRWGKRLGSSRAGNDLRIELQSWRTLSPVSDSFIGQVQELGAAAGHLNGDVAECGSAEFQPGGLAMPGAAKIFHLARSILLEFFD